MKRVPSHHWAQPCILYVSTTELILHKLYQASVEATTVPLTVSFHKNSLLSFGTGFIKPYILSKFFGFKNSLPWDSRLFSSYRYFLLNWVFLPMLKNFSHYIKVVYFQTKHDLTSKVESSPSSSPRTVESVSSNGTGTGHQGPQLPTITASQLLLQVKFFQ